MRHLFLPVTRAIALSCSALFNGPAFAQDIADTIYSGGTILTMDDSAPRAEALATKDGRILAVGALADLLAHQGESTRAYDLDGHTMLPGFVDSHGHVVMGGLQALSANLLAPPDGDVTDIPSLQEALRGWMADNQEAIAASNLIVGFGYDQSQLAEQRHPTKADLDAVSTDVPIILVHQSGHFGAVNTAALVANGITKRTPVPPGGIIRYGADGEPDGVLEENAFFMVLGQMLGGIGDEGFKAFARAGAKLWASFGYTTAQEGRATPQVAAIAHEVAAEGGMGVDVVVYPDVLVDRDFILANQSATYDNGVRIGGAKLTIDGSPQGFTALRDRPYFDPVGNYPPGYAGYASATAEQVQDAINWAFGNDIQILTHANGEGASDMLIAAIDAAEATHGRADRRPVLIHGQFLRPDQVAALDRLDVFPSLFPMHTFYWGDWHRDRTVGPINADNISPTGWVRERGMMFGTHHDAPVAFPDSMRVLSATVTRRTRSGDILGPHQRVDVMTALKAMTLWPAYQHFEEAEKGSLEVGKIADFVILSDDPTAVDPEALDTLKVVATIKDDGEIYRAKDGPRKTLLVPPVGHHVLDVAHAAARKN
ncbi:amidohydrolase [Shimia sp. R9_2]|uniref:amidohydrolase n=1 Tax=Shimia sp. R9_2 TaxID=2821112 RepID=UPI001ADA4D65|nr:amidohydrolase [Shimia sp. R9_2]MBO9395806.1 amidohydrolase [Shimia sp. R9_2]